MPNLYRANFKQMLRRAQLCYIKHNIQTCHINDTSNKELVITLTRLHGCITTICTVD